MPEIELGPFAHRACSHPLTLPPAQKFLYFLLCDSRLSVGTRPAIQSAFSLQMAIVFSVSMSKWKYARERQALPEMAGLFLWAVCSLQCCLWLHDLAGFCSLSISTSRKLPACWSVPVSASANIRCENLKWI